MNVDPCHLTAERLQTSVNQLNNRVSTLETQIVNLQQGEKRMHDVCNELNKNVVKLSTQLAVLNGESKARRYYVDNNYKLIGVLVGLAALAGTLLPLVKKLLQ